MNLTLLAALGGIVFGTAGFVLGVLNYLRDQPKIVVRLQWDMRHSNIPGLDPQKKYGIVSITNAGRRAVFIENAFLRLPTNSDKKWALLIDSFGNRKLAEGDAPVFYPVLQEGLDVHARRWRHVRAVVSDSTGKKYVSKKVSGTHVPSWAKQDQAT
jgi:hypothetical protein